MSCITQQVCAPYDTSLYGDGELYGSSEFYNSAYLLASNVESQAVHFLSTRVTYSGGAKLQLYALRPYLSPRTTRTPSGQYVCVTEALVPQALSMRVTYSGGAALTLTALRPSVTRWGPTAQTYGVYVTLADTPCPQFLSVRIRYSEGADFRVTAIMPDLNIKHQRPVV